MKPHEVKSDPRNRRMSNVGGWVRLRSVIFYKIGRSTQSLDPEVLEGRLTTDRIHYSDPPAAEYSLFDIRFFRVSSTIRLDARGRRLG